MYCEITDITTTIGEASLIELTDDANTGEVDEAVVTAEIVNADAEINGYCGKKYSVPFATVPALIKKYSVDITIYNLYSRRRGAPEDRRNRYKDAIAFLQGISAGKNTLGESDPDGTPASTDAPTISSSVRIFSRTKMEGF